MGSYTAGYHAAMKDNIDRILTEQPEYLVLCYQYMKSLQAGAFDSELVNAIFQEWERHTVTISCPTCIISILNEVLRVGRITANSFIYSIVPINGLTLEKCIDISL